MEILDAIRNVGLTLAALAGGLWAFYKFRKMRMVESKLEIELIPEVYPHVESKIVDVSIIFKNVGNIVLYNKIPSNECILEVKAISDELKDSVVTWNDAKLLSLFPPIKYLEQEHWRHDIPYTFEPGEKATFHVFFSTNYNGIIIIKVSFVDKEDYMWTAYKVINLKATTNNGIYRS